MGPAEWRLAAMAMTMLALALTSCQLVRSIWQGQPVSVRRYRSILLVEIAAGVLFSQPGDRTDDTVVAGAIETAPCLGTAGVAGFRPHGELVTIEGVGRPAPGCAIWAVIEDTSGGGFWLQGPAIQHDAAWSLGLVIGADNTTGEPSGYHVSLIVVDAPAHAPWQAAALAGAPIRLPSRPAAAAHLAQRHIKR
jgi:hypothetical protein